ncbi:LysR family transcriptional regulator [Microbacterium sp. SORGH_AS_0862]|uniref:LysR family transcriptional regulator n=1 Tax=Microbacterium sp. SORGH_AS_0862 TaxID=3041789 RepID=UPI0027926B72|nr:LysR family transcriptional regulator [Microbacterium sp. SORGH_AS_0862]MDQ1204822.1 DNA-binding transcriptional LysR family regulator [Microbacterium sp. SORGH_AS_0862]
MANGDPDLNLLVSLRALLEEANVTRAGERIGVGQSTMSSALARLRALFLDELLVRVGRDYELTPLARQILPQVQRTLPLVALALGQEESFEPATSRRSFTIQVTDYGAIELRPLFALANALAPGIRFDFPRLPADPVDTDHDMLAHDFAVAPPGIGIEAEGMDLFRDPYVVVADRKNPRVADGRISLDDFVQSPLIRCDFGRGHLTPAERRMREVGALPHVRVTTSTMLAIPLIIGGGSDLIGVLPRRLAERNRAATGTVLVPTPFPDVELIQRLWWHPSHARDEGHRWFRDLAAETVASGALEP